jgi:hypothetical protein
MDGRRAKPAPLVPSLEPRVRFSTQVEGSGCVVEETRSFRPKSSTRDATKVRSVLGSCFPSRKPAQEVLRPTRDQSADPRRAGPPDELTKWPRLSPSVASTRSMPREGTLG